MLTTSLVALSGCLTQKVWHKPYAVRADFDEERYQCLQDAKTSSGTNDFMFNACMNSKGWSLKDKEESVNLYSKQSAEFKSDSEAAGNIFEINRHKIQAVLSKSPVTIAEITPEHLADNSKASDEEKAQLLEFSKVFDSYIEQVIKIEKKYSGRKSARLTEIAHKYSSEMSDLRLKLYAQKITWGEYNLGRRVANQSYAERRKQELSQ